MLWVTDGSDGHRLLGKVWPPALHCGWTDSGTLSCLQGWLTSCEGGGLCSQASRLLSRPPAHCAGLHTLRGGLRVAGLTSPSPGSLKRGCQIGQSSHGCISIPSIFEMKLLTPASREISGGSFHFKWLIRAVFSSLTTNAKNKTEKYTFKWSFQQVWGQSIITKFTYVPLPISSYLNLICVRR